MELGGSFRIFVACGLLLSVSVGTFQVPPFLNCDGEPFHPSWAEFRKHAIANAKAGYPRDEHLREKASALIGNFEPSMLAGARAWVVHLRSAASGDIYRLKLPDGSFSDAARNATVMTKADVTDADQIQAKGIAETPSDDQHLDEAASLAPMAFCLYGYVQALFVEFRHTVTREHLVEDFPAMKDDPTLASCDARRPLLQVAEQLLGGETRETDFLESSDWPLSTLDLHLSLYSSHRFRRGPDCHVIFDPGHLPPMPPEGWPVATVTVSELGVAASKTRTIQMAALGLHVASTLEPVAALRSAARHALDLPEGLVSVAYFGHPCYGRPGDGMLKHACIYKCEMLGAPCGDDAVADLLKGMFNTSSGLYEELPWSLQDALGALAAIRQAEAALMSADLLVCSGPLALCHLLDILMPLTPLVMPVCSQLLWGAQPGEAPAATLLGHVRLMAQSQTRFLVACNRFAAAQCFYQTGVALPVVERVAHYIPSQVRWSANKPEGRSKEVLVLRARYWHRLPGQYFMDVLEAYLRLNEFSHNFTFVMAASYGPDDLPPAEMARYRATVLVPNDLTVFAFVEIYAMGVPTFVPSPEWLYRLRRAAPFGFLQPSLSLPDIDAVQASFKFPPFVSVGGRTDPEDLLAFLHWQRLSELHTRPHVQQFSSIPELLELTGSVDLHQISSGMLKHTQVLRDEAAAAWGGALQRLLSEAPQVNSAGSVAFGADAGVGSQASHGLQASATGGLQVMLDCTGSHHAAWDAFREALQHNAVKGFPVDWNLQTMAGLLWKNVQEADPQELAAASALFHQAIMGDADPELVVHSGHCHFGSVAVLFVLARHGLPGAGGHVEEARQNVALATEMLGGSSALDFLEDSSWPLSALDLASLEDALRSLDGRGFTAARFSGSGAVAVRLVESSVPWNFAAGALPAATRPVVVPEHSHWQVAVAGAHPSLCADIAEAVRSALEGRSEHRFYGLSCPEHHAASHHCHFRCHMLGQCSNDAVFSDILSKMMNWAEFEEQAYDEEAVMDKLRIIIKADSFLSSADLLVCTGPYVLCSMLRELLTAIPLLVYLGLAMTYLAAPASVERVLLSAHSVASVVPALHRLQPGARGVELSSSRAPSALLVTDLVRAAQFRHATGVWVPAVPPLSLYQQGSLAAKGARSSSMPLRVIALRPELWRRAAFGPGLRGLLRQLGAAQSVTVAFQRSFLPMEEIASHAAAMLIPWDNDVMSFYELYHAAMPLLIPAESLMTKWLPAVRWGSLEFDKLSGNLPACLARVGKHDTMLAPWMDQSTVRAALAGDAYAWVSATDYYRFPHVLHFNSVAGLIATVRGAELAAVSADMRTSSKRIRSHSLSFHRHVLSQLLSKGSGSDSAMIPSPARSDAVLNLKDNWRQLPVGGTCRQGFVAQEDFVSVSREDAEDAIAMSWRCLQLCDETAGCMLAAFNGLTCMVYDSRCDKHDLRREGDRAAYAAWIRKSAG